MVKFGSVCILISLVVIIVHSKEYSRQVQIDKLKFRLFEALSDNGHDQIYTALQTSQNIFAETSSDVGANAIAATAGLAVALTVPPVGTVAAILAFLPILVTALKEETDWKKNFVHALRNREDINNAQNELKEIKNILNNKFSIRLNQLENTNDKANHLHDMDINLTEMLGYFSNRASPLRKLPELAAPVLLALSPIIAHFMELLKREDPKYRATSTFVPCILQNIIREYADLTVMSRLNNIEVRSAAGVANELNTYKMTQERLSETGPPSALEMRSISDLACEVRTKEYDYISELAYHAIQYIDYKKSKNFTIVKDALNKEDDIVIYDESGACANAYFDVVKNRIASEFRKASDVAEVQCKASRPVPKETTSILPY